MNRPFLNPPHSGLRAFAAVRPRASLPKDFRKDRETLETGLAAVLSQAWGQGDCCASLITARRKAVFVLPPLWSQ